MFALVKTETSQHKRPDAFGVRPSPLPASHCESLAKWHGSIAGQVAWQHCYQCITLAYQQMPKNKSQMSSQKQPLFVLTIRDNNKLVYS
jgi:hypothetical protein